MESNDHSAFAEPLLEKIENYGRTGAELIRLKAMHKTAMVTSKAFTVGLLFLLLSMFVLILTLAISLWLGEQFGSLSFGFLCVAGFYAFAFVSIYLFFKNAIRKALTDQIVDSLLN